MTDAPNDGGPVYPELRQTMTPAGMIEHDFTRGMSLRDWFAGQALAGFGANPDTRSWNRNQMAKACYAQADAMIAARDKAGAA